MTRWVALLALVVALYAAHVAFAGWVWEDVDWIGAATLTPGPRWLASLAWLVAPTPVLAHGLSVGIHLAVVALVGVLAWRLAFSGAAIWLAAALMAVHPVTVQAVAYAAARTELIAAIGVLVAVICAAGHWWKPVNLALIVGGLVLGMLGKDSAVIALVLVPLTIAVQRRQAPPTVWGYALMAGFVAGIAGLALYGRDLAGLINIGQDLGVTVTWQNWTITQGTAIARTFLAFIPVISLTPDYDYDAVPLILQMFSLCALGSLGLAIVALWRSKPLVAYGLGWAWLAMLPRLIVQTPRSYFNDHQAYTPLIGLILASVAYWDDWRQPSRSLSGQLG